MCLGTFLRLRRSLATSALYAAVRILAERFCVVGTKFPITQKIPAGCVTDRHLKTISRFLLQHSLQAQALPTAAPP